MRAIKQNSELRKDQIVRAAMTLIADQGLKGLNVAAVARKVGIVPSALYRHFRGKEEILEATRGLVRDLLMENLQAVRQETSQPLEQLRLLLVRHIQMAREFQAIPRIVFSDEPLSSHPRRKTAIYKIIREFLGQVAEIIVQGQRLHQINPHLDPETLSVIFLGIVQPPIILWHLTDGRFDLSKHLKKAWPIFMAALSAEAPKALYGMNGASKAKK
jgi:AcrR family transcriptional regulator